MALQRRKDNLDAVGIEKAIMKAGVLVEITRRSIGVPSGTIALITDTVHTEIFTSDQHDIIKYHIVRLVCTKWAGKERRFHERDLEVISGSR